MTSSRRTQLYETVDERRGALVLLTRRAVPPLVLELMVALPQPLAGAQPHAGHGEGVVLA